MSGKAKTLLIIAGMIVVYFFSLNAVLKNRTESPGTAAPQPMAYGDGADAEAGPRGGIIGDLEVGNVVTFGVYEQDNKFDNGEEPLEWDVIGQKDDCYLLITHYVIDGKKFDDSSSDTTLRANESNAEAQATWEKSSLRAWLNGEFYQKAFTGEEQAVIQQAHLKTSDFRSFDTGYLGFGDTGSAKANGIGGGDTDDRVFLLSYEEFEQYFKPVRALNMVNRMQCGKAIVSPTKYARKQGVTYYSLAHEVFNDPANPRNLSEFYLNNLRPDVSADYEENGYVSSWITRSPGCYEGGTAVLSIVSGYTCFSPSAMKTEVQGIRPAIWVKK